MNDRYELNKEYQQMKVREKKSDVKKKMEERKGDIRKEMK